MRICLPVIVCLGGALVADAAHAQATRQAAGGRSSATPARENDEARQRRYDAIVNDFIAYDVGELRGEAGARAYNDFNALQGDEVIPALVRGVNRAAGINNSCPIIVISRKLQGMLQNSRDAEMVGYALDHLDDKTPGLVYGSYVQSLKQFADRRYADLTGGQPRLPKGVLRGGGTPSQLRRSQQPVEKWSYEDLVEAVGQEKEVVLAEILERLCAQPGPEYTTALVDAIETVPADSKALARGLLAQRFVRMTDATLQRKLTDMNPEVRAAAARAIGYKGSPLWADLAQAVRDRDSQVAQYAHDSLVKLTGQDLGPPAGTKSYARWYQASQQWEKWVAEQSATPNRTTAP